MESGSELENIKSILPLLLLEADPYPKEEEEETVALYCVLDKLIIVLVAELFSKLPFNIKFCAFILKAQNINSIKVNFFTPQK